LDVRLVISDAERREEVEEYAKEKKIRFPVLHDPEGLNAKAWALGGIAYGLLLGSDGSVVWQGRIGPQGDADGCESAIRRQLTARPSLGGAPPR